MSVTGDSESAVSAAVTPGGRVAAGTTGGRTAAGTAAGKTAAGTTGGKTAAGTAAEVASTTLVGAVRVSVDAQPRTPASEQLRAQIVQAVSGGELAPGIRLPAVRALADALGLAPNTVAKVYRELERDEIVITRGRNGTTVAPVGEGPARQAQAAALTFAARIRELGVADTDALAFVEAALRAAPPS
ncbi:GntR family transcriptional regulator [Subtercola endophyticus]|uniref:GntR family transcriptional regulator n=1 Tax=Subtercola endophyticus TaxID=2895559 RepID=UPI001E58DFB3|nr:GntR family transcriptional regulator [Subtercola endophyticus]UFS58436.1 GntR family transcriptional regulator [Subtercola endophyticus]